MKAVKFLQIIVILGASLLGSACILEMAAPTPQTSVTTATPEQTSEAPGSLASPTWTLTLTATFTPSLTATFTNTPVTLTAGQSLSCVKGPDWMLYEWVAGIAEGEVVTLIARAVPAIPDYYVVRMSNGTECWAFGGSSTISGSTANLPVRETPPLPTVNFVVRNRIYADLISVYIRPAGGSAWGANLLAALIPAGGETAIPITAGHYDVRILGPFPTAIYEAYNRVISPDPNYRILEVAIDANFTIRNLLPGNVCWLDVQVSGGSWQKLYDAADGGGPILPGQTRDFTSRSGVYSLRATYCTHVVLPGTPTVYVYPGMPVFLMD
jgi:hypothetical protein